MNDLEMITPKLKELAIAKTMPAQAYRVYGCINCEFKDTTFCNHNISKNSQFTALDNEFDAICSKKLWYTLSMYSGKKTNPSFEELARDYNKVTHQQLIQNILNNIRKTKDHLLLLQEEFKTTESENARNTLQEKITMVKSQEFIYEQHILNFITNFRKLDQKDEELNIKTNNPNDYRKMTVQEMNVFIDNSVQELKKTDKLMLK